MKKIENILKNNTNIGSSHKNKDKIIDLLKREIDNEIEGKDFYFDKNVLKLNLLPPQKTIFKPKKTAITKEINTITKVNNIKIINW